MKKNNFRLAVVLVLLSALVVLPFMHAEAQDDVSEISAANAPAIPATVFQAAGPTAVSIQSAVDQYRAALGVQNNGNNPGPLLLGRREINWDGGSTTNVTTAVVGNPFSGFLITRGALFTTPDGTGSCRHQPVPIHSSFRPEVSPAFLTTRLTAASLKLSARRDCSPRLEGRLPGWTSSCPVAATYPRL
jgi:hypothetical protein